MAAAVVSSPNFGHKNTNESNKDSVRFHRYTVVAGNGDTFDTGFGTKVGIKEVLIGGTATQAGPTGNMTITSVSAGVITFGAAASTAFDLIVVTNL